MPQIPKDSSTPVSWYWPDVTTARGAGRAVLYGTIAAAWLCINFILLYFQDHRHLPGTFNGNVSLAIYTLISAMMGFLAYRIFFRSGIISSIVVILLTSLIFVFQITQHRTEIPSNISTIFTLITLLLFSINGVRGTFSNKRNRKQIIHWKLKEFYWPDVTTGDGTRRAFLQGFLAAAWIFLSFFDALFKDDKGLFGNNIHIPNVISNFMLIVAAVLLCHRTLKKRCILTSLIIISYSTFFFLCQFIFDDLSISWDIIFPCIACLFAVNNLRGILANRKTSDIGMPSESSEATSTQAEGSS